MLRVIWLFAVLNTITVLSQARTYYQCNNDLCNRIDALLKRSFNLNTNACNDFRASTCRLRNSTSSGTSGNIRDAFNDLDTAQNQDTNILRSILDDTNENVTNSLKLERQIFNNCYVYGVRTDLDKYQYYESLPQKAKNLELQNGLEEDSQHWILSDLEYANNGYGFAFFDFKIIERLDKYNRKKRFIQISPPTDNILDIYSLFVKKYYSQDKQTLLSYKKLKIFLGALNGIILKNSDQDEDQLQSIEDWQNKWNDRVHRQETASVNWKKLIWQKFVVANVKAPTENFKIIVKDEYYFFNLIKLLSSTNMQIIENYVHLRYISKTIGLVDVEYIEYSVIPKISKLMCTPGLFVGTAHAYAVKYFPKSNQEKLKEVVRAVRLNIRNYMTRKFGYNWDEVSERTKTFLNNLEYAEIMYGYPSWLLDENLLANFYPDRLDVNDGYFKTVDAIYKSVLKHNLRAYNDYRLPIIAINELFKAFESDKIEIFERKSNKIVIPVRMFSESNFPFFSSSLHDSFNYGSVATTLAYEIYMKYLDSIDDVDDVTDCMNSQLPRNLTSFEAADYSRKTTAYLMAVLTAYEVLPSKEDFKSSVILFKESGAITVPQLFFFSFSQTLCKTQGDSNELDTEIEPSQCLNLVVSNVKEFQEAFLCKDAYNQKQKCNPLKY